MAHQISTIIIKSQTASGEEEVEEIELDDATTGTLFDQYSVPGNVSVMEGTDVLDVQSILQNIHAQSTTTITSVDDGGGGGGGGGGGTYIFNPDTGEIQMLDLNDATMIGGDEVEVVTVDTERMLEDADNEGMHSEQIVQFAEDVKPPSMASYEFLQGRRIHTAAMHPPPVSRFKSAPALLRNSRRVLPVEQPMDSTLDPLSHGVTSRNRSSRPTVNNRAGNRRAKRSISPTGRLIKPTFQRQKPATLPYVVGSVGASSQQIFMLNPSDVGQISQLVESPQPVHTIQMQGDSGSEGVVRRMRTDSEAQSGQQMQPTYYIYQDANGDQVAELVEDSLPAPNLVDQTSNNIIYQFENNSMFLQDGDLQNIGTITLSLPKKAKPKVNKKRPKKISSTDIKTEDGSTKLRRGQTELKCLEKGCQAVAYNVLELRKHLTAYHDMLFDMDQVTFPSDAAFKEWREQYERERMVSFIYRGGTKKIAKYQAVTYMICHRSGHYKPTMVDTSQRKRKMKPQGSCKIGGYCTAGIKLLKNLESGEVKMDICHTHYGHPLDNDALPHLRVNPTLRKMILKKFEEGMNFSDVLAYIHHNPDGLEGLRMVDRRAVRNIFDTWKTPVKRVKKTSTSNETGETTIGNSEEITGNIEDSENPEMEDEDGESILPTISNEKTAEESLVEEGQNETVHVGPDLASLKEETMMHSIPDLPVEEEENIMGNCDEDSAPVLQVAGEEYGEDEMMDDDSNPPLLIAIESIKSLKPLSPVSQAPISPKRKGRKKGKGVKKKMKTTNQKTEDDKPIIVRTESITDKGQESPASSKSSYKLRPHKKDIVSEDKNQPKNKLSEEEFQEVISAATSASKPTRSKSKTNEKRLLKLKHAKPTESPPQHVDDEIINSPIAETSPLHYNALSDLGSDQDDFDLMQIQISPEMEAAIDKLNNHGESGPTILLYKKIGDINTKYGGFCRAFREDDFCLIIQTPVQRQIMQMFPKVIGIEILDGPKPNEHDLKLAFAMVLDDFREAIPVAWMIADTMCSRILNQFFRMLRYHCGELQTQYIMAPKNADVYKTWTAHFSNKPKMLQSEFCARRDLRNLVNRHFPNDSTRAKAVNFVEEIITEKKLDNLKNLKDKLSQLVKGCPNGPNFLRKFEKDWYARVDEWSFAYRVALPVNLLFVADGFLKLKKFVSFKGTRKLNQSVNHILKIGYDKCFLRTKRLFKGDQKFSNLLEKVEKNHKASKETLANASVSSYEDDENTWIIETDTGVVEQVFNLQSSCNCKIRCSVCKVCMHEYMCTCKDFAKLKVMCAHIHKTHCCRHEISDEGGDEEEEQQHEIIVKAVDADDPEIITVPANATTIAVEKPPEVTLCEGAEITILSESQIQELNLTGFLNASGAGLFGREEGQDMPKIVSITDADTQKVIYSESSGSATPFIFHLTE